MRRLRLRDFPVDWPVGNPFLLNCDGAGCGAAIHLDQNIYSCPQRKCDRDMCEPCGKGGTVPAARQDEEPQEAPPPQAPPPPPPAEERARRVRRDTGIRGGTSTADAHASDAEREVPGSAEKEKEAAGQRKRVARRRAGALLGEPE